MKANITLKIEKELLRKARVLAAEDGTSVSALVASQLDQVVFRRGMYERARRSALARLKTGYDLNWIPPASRDELYER
jgi:hypothetical protein